LAVEEEVREGPMTRLRMHHVGFLVDELAEGARHFRDDARFAIESDVSEDRVQTARVQFLRMVRATTDALACARHASSDIQTIGLTPPGRRRLVFAEQAALRGAKRFPAIGRMTHCQSPWDGSFVMDRMVRRVSLGGPL
jgi:Acyl-CoA reductase (LuxC)